MVCVSSGTASSRRIGPRSTHGKRLRSASPGTHTPMQCTSTFVWEAGERRLWHTLQHTRRVIGMPWLILFEWRAPECVHAQCHRDSMASTRGWARSEPGRMHTEVAEEEGCCGRHGWFHLCNLVKYHHHSYNGYVICKGGDCATIVVGMDGLSKDGESDTYLQRGGHWSLSLHFFVDFTTATTYNYC